MLDGLKRSVAIPIYKSNGGVQSYTSYRETELTYD